MKLQHLKHLFIMLLFAASQAGFSQDSAPSPEAAKANEYYLAQDWKNAAMVYKTITESEPTNAQAWYRLGRSNYELKKYNESASAYQEADKLEFYPFITRYNIACAYALMNKVDDAFTWLDKAMEAGYSNTESLKTDEDIAMLRQDARFESIAAKADKNARPCMFDPKYNEFDFWVGEWEVFNPQGQKVGENIIEKDLNGCMLVENWTSVSGGSGKSINYYEPGSGKWKQNWVDATGGIVWYQGEVKDGAMHFSGENISKDGTKTLARVVLKPLADGKVHHFIENSADGGETWTLYFDGTYVKKENSQPDNASN